MLDKFADELKEAREKSNISIQQIAQKSRIDLKFIDAIDRGDFSFLPELYVKAFIKQYAKVVGLDESITIKKYEAAKAGRPYEEDIEKKQSDKKDFKAPVEEKKPVINNIDKSRSTQSVKYFQEKSSANNGAEQVSFSERLKKDKTLLAIIIAGAVIIIFAAVYFLFIHSNSDIIVTEKPYDEVQKENLQRYTAEKENEVPAVPINSDSLTLLINTTDTSWLKISIDGKNVEEFKLYPNSTKEIKAAQNYSMTVGNAGVTHFKLDGKDLNFSGEKKQVKYISIDKDGLKYLDKEPLFK